VSLNSSGLMPTAASTAVSAASGVWLRRVLLAVAAFETLVGLIDLAVFVPDLNIINARLFIHAFFAISAVVLAARRHLRAAIVVLAAYILAALASGEPALRLLKLGCIKTSFATFSAIGSSDTTTRTIGPNQLASI
jgi:hypothetical protein